MREREWFRDKVHLMIGGTTSAAESHAQTVANLRTVLPAESVADAPTASADDSACHREPRSTGAEHDVFVSNVAEDQDLAFKIADHLEDAGYRVWRFERDALPAVSYLTQIGQAIAASRAFLLLISAQSLSSHEIDIELERAHEESKPFIPVCSGISHVEFQTRRPLWRQAMGTTTSIQLDRDTLAVGVRRIVDGMKALGILPTQNRNETMA